MQHLQLEWCTQAIMRAEKRRERRFDLVVHVRPDLLWLRPVEPWCRWQSRQEDKRRQMFSCPGLGCDFFWAVERKYMTYLFGQARLYHECDENPGVEFLPERHQGGCCSFSESLLSYAKNYSTPSNKAPLSSFWPVQHMFTKFRLANEHEDAIICGNRDWLKGIFGDTSLAQALCRAQLRNHGNLHVMSDKRTSRTSLPQVAPTAKIGRCCKPAGCVVLQHVDRHRAKYVRGARRAAAVWHRHRVRERRARGSSGAAHRV